MSNVEEKTCRTCGRVYKSEKDFLRDTSRWRICDMRHLWFNCSCQSTLMIKKGKYDWYSPDLFMGKEAQGVFNKLGNLNDLPHLSNSVMEIQQALTSAEDVDMKQLAAQIKKEPFIGAAVLHTAEVQRSTRSGSANPIESIEHAVVYIGAKSLSDIVTSAAIRSFSIRINSS